jgi:hypothetical protein
MNLCRIRFSVDGVFRPVVIGVAPVGVKLPELELVPQGASNQTCLKISTIFQIVFGLYYITLNGATTLSITTFSIMTLRIKALNMTLSIRDSA